MLWRRQQRGPEIRATARRYRRDDLSHAQCDDEGEEGDDNPTDGHYAWPTGEQAVGEKCGDACNDGLHGVSRGKSNRRRVGKRKRTMIEKDMPKLCNRPQSRRNSCLYPNCASSSSSRRSISSSAAVCGAMVVVPQKLGVRTSVPVRCGSLSWS
jgi:hypothetical protein